MARKAFHGVHEKVVLVKLARKNVAATQIAERMMVPISVYIDETILNAMGGRDNMKEDWLKSMELAYKLGQISMGKGVVSINGIPLKKDEEDKDEDSMDNN